MKRKRLIRPLYYYLLLLSASALLSGCTHDMSRKEIDEIDMVLVLAIDYSDGEYSLNALYSSGGGADPESGGSEAKEDTATGTGKTAYEALENLKLKNKKAITLAQAGSFLIGEAAAEQGLKECLDFLSRDETIKMEALIYIIQGGSAEDFIKKGQENKQTIHEDLDAIKQKQQESLTRNDNTMVNILNDMKQTYSCVLIPYLIAEESGYLIEGYTVFDDYKLADYLDHQTSDGVNFIRNIMRSYPIILEHTGLFVTYTNTRLKADLKEDRIQVTININFESMFKEITTQENLFERKQLEQLTKVQNDYIRTILEKPVNYSIATGRDILNLARLIENQNFTDWKDIKVSWPDMVRNIEYKYELKSRISKTFLF